MSVFRFRNLVLAACAWLPVLAIGCGTLNPFRPRTSPIDFTPDVPAFQPGDGWFFLNWLGFVCVAGGVAVLILSAWVPIFRSPKAAFTSIVCGVGCILLRRFMERFETPILIGLFALVAIGFACLVWVLLKAAYHGTLLSKSKELLAAGHVDAAAAFRITATPGASKSRDIRKAILETMKGNS